MKATTRPTDAEALRKMSRAARKTIKDLNMYRCSVLDYCWHNPKAKTPNTCSKLCADQEDF